MTTDSYFEYLMTISPKGKLYRRLVVYPRIKRWTKGKTLDVGCGIGLFLRSLPQSTGVDVNSDCIAYCKSQGLDAHHMDFDVLPFSDDTFDTLVFDNVLEHIADPMPILVESARVLKPKGRIIALVPGKKGYRKDPDHKVFYDFERLTGLAVFAGLRVRNLSSLPVPGLTNTLSAFCYMAVFEVN